ncbi:MAG: alpha/beta hydrolase [Pseudomonadota bacterium]|nr:alpha/beta hydrolase [Pseudomonadota bacterium]MDE3037907.1 alpha/beta hydrolase [Pseudomonadota bacterium]
MIAQPVKNETETQPSFLELSEGRRLAYCLTPGSLPGIVFFGGFKSDMNGAKARALESFCREEGIRFLRFDYSGHGKSTGTFLQGSITQWRQDALDALDRLADGQHILVGSSMGAWIMLLAALARAEKVAGLVGLAAAPDFTERLIWQQFTPQQKKQMEEEGVVRLPSCDGGEPYPVTRALIEDGRRHLLLDNPIPLDVPVRLIHGMQDSDVPWRMSLSLMDRLRTSDISLELIKDGDHRLSYPSQLALMYRTVAELFLLARARKKSFASEEI